jgi:hypothetical protein
VRVKVVNLGGGVEAVGAAVVVCQCIRARPGSGAVRNIIEEPHDREVGELLSYGAELLGVELGQCIKTRAIRCNMVS